MALVKFSAMMAKVSHAALWPSTACHENARLAKPCANPPIQRLTGSEKARASEPPAKPPISVAASPTPLMIAAYSLREKPSSITKGAVIAPESASVNLKRTTKTKATTARSRVKNSENAPTAASATRCSEVSRDCAATAPADFSGSRATSVVATPMRTSTAIAA